MAKILITGANGQVGHCLVQQLSQRLSASELLALDRSGLDISDANAVQKIVADFRPNVIINAAAHTAVDKAESETALAESINVHGVKNLAEAANHVGTALLHISTDYVFGGDGTNAYLETDATNPQGVYGKTKLAGEHAAFAANSRTIVLRTAWVFGEHGNNFVKTMLRLGKDRDTLGVVGDQFGGPTYAGDIAAALIKIAFDIIGGREDAFGVYHFTGQPYVSWHGFAQAIFAEAVAQNVLAKAPQVNSITTVDYPTPAKRPANSRLDLGKIKATFDIEPSDWQAALKNLKDYAQ